MKILKLFNIPVKPKKLEMERTCLILSCRYIVFPIKHWLSTLLLNVPSNEKPSTSLKCLTARSFTDFCYCHTTLRALFAVTDMLILTLYFLIFFCPRNYLVFLLCLSILPKLNSFCAQTASKFLALFFVSLFFWKCIKHLFRGYAWFSFPSYFSFNKDFK